MASGQLETRQQRKAQYTQRKVKRDKLKAQLDQRSASFTLDGESEKAMFQLLNLPLELRERIYEFYVLDLYGAFPLTFRASTPFYQHQRLQLPDLMMVNRQVYSEVWPLAFGNSTFKHTVRTNGCPLQGPHYVTREVLWGPSLRHGFASIRHVRLDAEILRHSRAFKIFGPSNPLLENTLEIIKKAVEIFSEGYSHTAELASHETPPKRTLTIDLGRIFHLKELASIYASPSPALTNWGRMLDILGNTLLLARSSGGEDVLHVEVRYVEATTKEEKRVEDELRRMCEQLQVSLNCRANDPHRVRIPGLIKSFRNRTVIDT